MDPATKTAAQPAFGRALRPLWHLASEAIFLNHGSFGACPREVLAEQDRLRLGMEAQPDRFFREGIVPDRDGTPLRQAIGQLAAFVGAHPDRVALVENATAGVQAVVRSLTLAPGDEILVTDHTYNAVRLIVETRCAETGARARVVKLPLPAQADAIVAAFRDAMTPQVRLAIIDHITSPTALALPVERLLRELRRWDTQVLVDGAHAVGHVRLEVDALGADWYVSNAHKWLFAPKGTAFLHAAAEVAAATAPLVVSHYAGSGFPRAFDWAGTRDYTAWLSIPAALRFFASLDPPRAREYRAGLIRHATGRLAAIGARPVGSDELACAMRSFMLPQSRGATPADAEELVRGLWQRHRIQSMAVAFEQALLLRVSAQVYVDAEDVDALASALDRDGWPARAG
ncbi:MAG TPA: aminotransferase class V-fold PLP-dependent enzyme [Usitatibacter sp.]|nr:aminotransferase class V-fold PLP-dependent enzyme [Usitatibacter sp.]